MNSPEEKASSIRRTCRLLRAVLRTEGKWFTLSHMARSTGMPPNTTSRYLDALCKERWIERGSEVPTLDPRGEFPVGSRYRLTREILSLLVVQGLKAIKASEGV